jgi:uncharacterized membrane protein YphA (DoxX/SURF4 family)
MGGAALKRRTLIHRGIDGEIHRQRCAPPSCRRGLMTEPLSFALRLGIALLLLQAGFAKILSLGEFRSGLRTYRILPGSLEATVAFLVPAVELALGVLLITGVAFRVGVVAAVALFLTFSMAQVVTTRRGMTIDCHCFGTSASEKVSGATAARVAVLAVLSGMLLAAPAAGLPRLSTAVPVVPVAFAIAAVIRSIGLFPTVARAIVSPARLAPTPTYTPHVSLSEVGLDFSLKPIVPDRRKE